MEKEKVAEDSDQEEELITEIPGSSQDQVIAFDDAKEGDENEEDSNVNSFNDDIRRHHTGLLGAPPGERPSSVGNLKPPPHLDPRGDGMLSGGSTPSPDLRTPGSNVPGTELAEEDSEDDDKVEESEAGNSRQKLAPTGSMEVGETGAAAGRREEDGDDDDEDDDDDDVQAPAPEGAYDPAEYENLNVGAEIRELFSYIIRYTPQVIELEHRLRPFIPDYIPAVGDIDAFIKIAPPDGSETKLGLTVLDEPSARQSDATVLDLQLRTLARHTTAKTVSVKKVESAEKKPKVIDKWMTDISDLHRNKPAPTVGYTKRMPDFDSLMQEWPGELEDLLQDIRLPNASLDLDLENYAGLVCAIMDIPVYKSKIQSLHVLFTLYSEFRNSVHFRRLAEANFMDNEAEGDRLVIE